MKYRKFSDELKEQIVKEYQSVKGWNTILREYEIADSVLGRWIRKYQKYGCFPDNRGKSATRKARKVDIAEMNKDEYIAYLEMENDIFKKLHSLSKKPQK